MSQPNPAPDDKNTLLVAATESLVERTTPWLVDIGSWIFGGLIAFNLILLGPLITIRPVDRAIMVAITALALALPLDVAGLFVLRLARDLENTEYETDFENEVRQAIEGAGRTTEKQTAPPTVAQAAHKRRTGISLLYSSGILALCVVLTLAGVIAALWHTAWWIATAFAVMALISFVIVFIAVVASQPPRSPEEMALLRRYGEEYVRQAKQQATQDDEQA